MATKKSYSIKPYIVRKLITCYADNSVFEACNLMAEHNIGTIIIVDKTDKKKVLGIFTERDLVKNVIAAKIAMNETLDKVMTKKIVSADCDSSESKISYLMTKNKVKKIIITKDDNLYGIITQTDMIKILSDKWLI